MVRTLPTVSVNEEAMQAKKDYQYVNVTDLLPSDPVKKLCEELEAHLVSLFYASSLFMPQVSK